MCTEDQHTKVIDALGDIAKLLKHKGPIENSVPISATLPWIIDYREKKHIYIFSPVPIMLSCEEYGSLSIPPALWVSADIPIGTRVTAPNQSTAVIMKILYSDEAIHNPLLPGYGLFTTAIASGVTADTVIKSTAGVLNSILVTASGSNAVLVFDNATTHSGTQIGLVPSTATATGVPFVFNFPAVNGITVQGNSANPAVTISWT